MESIELQVKNLEKEVEDKMLELEELKRIKGVRDVIVEMTYKEVFDDVKHNYKRMFPNLRDNVYEREARSAIHKFLELNKINEISMIRDIPTKLIFPLYKNSISTNLSISNAFAF